MSKTTVCQKALNHLAVSKRLGNVDSDTTPEALACRDFYDDARDLCFRDALWPFTTRLRTLTLVEEQPTNEWQYAYRYPADCMRIVRIPSDVQPETLATRVAYRVIADTTGKRILTNKADAEIEYVIQQVDDTKWTPDFRIAFTYLLASMIAPTVTKGDPHKLGIRAYSAYEVMIGKAYQNAANEETPVEQTSSLAEARE